MTVDFRTPCGIEGPMLTGRQTAKGTGPPKPAVCNRPRGHEGDHRDSTGSATVRASWTGRYLAGAAVPITPASAGPSTVSAVAPGAVRRRAKP